MSSLADTFVRPTPRLLPTRAVAALLLVWVTGLISGSASWAQQSLVREWNEVMLDAIRSDLARPTVHARNLHHWSAACYDAWAAYDTLAEPFLVEVSVAAIEDPAQRRWAQEEAINYASYRILWNRFLNSPGGTATLMSLYQQFALNGGVNSFQSTDYVNDGPAALGNYIAQQVLAQGALDGSNEANDYANQHYTPLNPDLFIESVPGNPMLVQPNHWQSISLSTFVGQSGIPESETPPFLSPEWGSVVPFGLPDSVKSLHFAADGWPYPVWVDQGEPPLIDLNNAQGIDDPYVWGHGMVLRWSEHLDPTDGVLIDISPASVGNVDPTLFYLDFTEYDQFYDWENGGDASQGWNVNPATGLPYEPQIVPRGDYARVLAEFWADGPDSETPPGHWFTLVNTVMDHPDFEPRWMGEGEPWDLFDWEVCAYFTLGGALHDAAIAAWSHKGWYDYIRPVSALRWMQGRGQCTDPSLPSYDAAGLPLIEGFCELVAPGDNDFPSASDVDKLKVRAWQGPDFISHPNTDEAGVDWILAENWWPYQRPSFVTPPFAGYVSGHSTFSRAAAEILTAITGDPYFPGGMGEFTAPANEFLVFEDGPSQDVVLQWATYRDASDQCSLSRIWGGIHPPCDDLPGRRIGLAVAEHALNMARTHIEAHVPCTADLNNDGLRGIDDLLILLSSYNGAPSQGNEDLTGDGFVGVGDILEFLLYFDQACN